MSIGVHTDTQKRTQLFFEFFYGWIDSSHLFGSFPDELQLTY